MAKLILFNKPYQVLCQFSGKDRRLTLAEYISVKDVYPAGRLDYDSEGLMLLTDDGRLQARISQPGGKLLKTYWAQVEGNADETRCNQLVKGVKLNDGEASAITCRPITPPKIWPRNPPVRFRKHDVTSWLELQLDEGRNRQVRRMTAAVGLPTLRLVRVAIGPWRLGELQPGESRHELVHLPQSLTKGKRLQQ